MQPVAKVIRAASARTVDSRGPDSETHSMEHKIVQDGITFDDVLLIPALSAVTPDRADPSTRLTRNIRLNIPLVSAPMDTVTEATLAIALAQEGGIGIIHKNIPPAKQAREVARVKRSENGVIADRPSQFFCYVVPECLPGKGDCDENPANGCETSTSTVSDCGACGVSCANPHGVTSCVAGLCTPVCEAGFEAVLPGIEPPHARLTLGEALIDLRDGLVASAARRGVGIGACNFGHRFFLSPLFGGDA